MKKRFYLLFALIIISAIIGNVFSNDSPLSGMAIIKADSNPYDFDQALELAQVDETIMIMKYLVFGVLLSVGLIYRRDVVTSITKKTNNISNIINEKRKLKQKMDRDNKNLSLDKQIKQRKDNLKDISNDIDKIKKDFYKNKKNNIY
ncbi:hypothetical protein HOK68_01030 [Candidatus Woesearchaeota archaeon]|jgi:gamma-glutamylcysteine synthetase|nr:hypothetical protein [Candidatus Woesearchaeota archaeon]MBT4387687.1 hypothetical protein [Candidatus Woesearchaeota archaeon]MBT4595950.1 hypothetical protein [Candidatus Woesearchaeota archaeon]MBT5741080.1 hypothetical protein [Candidatus Woesearchaeota archaeon]MBT6505344.1 hypothetical protein [Candidatus Woesearchaeota archaeon]